MAIDINFRAMDELERRDPDPRQLMLPPPVIRDGIGMVFLGDQVVWFDMAEHVIAPGELAAVIDPYTQAPTLFQHPRPDAEWPERPRRPRRVMMPTAPTIPSVVREWSETIVLGRVIATRRVTP